MAPKKKAQKVSLNDFLASEGGGSWADEMELPSAPAMRTDEERGSFGKRDDFLSSRPDRQNGPPREDLPLPTQAPYTAFIGNLAFDLTENEVQDFFGTSQTKTIKIIKDREDKPKGFGYVEFETLDGLKDALSKSGSSLSGRTVRVSVAEPPKGGFGGGGGGGFEDDAKFDSPWRRDGPLPDLPGSRDASRRRFDASSGGGPGGPPPLGPSVSEGVDDWRSMRPPRATGPPPPPSSSEPEFKRRTSNFGSPAEPGAADTEEVWSKGSKFTPAPVVSDDGPRFGGGPRRGDMGPPRERDAGPAPEDAADWRSVPRPVRPTRDSASPSNSTPPTPVLSRRKLELLPRSGSPSVSPSPLSSPRLPPATVAVVTPSAAPRANPFGAAKPVDAAAREKEVAERQEKERLAAAQAAKERVPHPMSRTSSRTAADRGGSIVSNAPDRAARGSISGPSVRGAGAPGATSASSSVPPSPRAPTATYAAVRPTMSFASMAKAKREEEEKEKNATAASKGGKEKNATAASKGGKEEVKREEGKDAVEEVTEKVAEASI